MKKFVSFLVALCSCVALTGAFAACDEEQSKESETTVSAGITEEKWNEAIAESNFDNVTFAFSGQFIEGPKGDQDEFGYVCKISGNSATMDNEVLDGEQVASLKSVYINTANAIVKDFDDFTYDEASETYKSKQDIVYTVTVMGMDATITAQNVSVTLDETDKIASISCKMKQNFTERGSLKEYVLDITFTYSNYGTTVIG